MTMNPNVRDVKAAIRDFERNLEKADLEREKLQPDERSKDSLLSLYYSNTDKAMCNLRRMGLLTW